MPWCTMGWSTKACALGDPPCFTRKVIMSLAKQSRGASKLLVPYRESKCPGSWSFRRSACGVVAGGNPMKTKQKTQKTTVFNRVLGSCADQDWPRASIFQMTWQLEEGPLRADETKAQTSPRSSPCFSTSTTRSSRALHHQDGSCP